MVAKLLNDIAQKLLSQAQDQAQLRDVPWTQAEFQASFRSDAGLMRYEVLRFEDGKNRRLGFVDATDECCKILDLCYNQKRDWTGAFVRVFPDGSTESGIVSDPDWEQQYVKFTDSV